MSKGLVEFAKENRCGLRFEDLKGIRKTSKSAKSFRYSLNSWSFYQLQTFVEYKAKLLGVPVEKVDPRYSSKTCSKCGQIGKRNDKQFQCPYCGHVDNADVNAAFNIGTEMHYQNITDRDAMLGSAGTPNTS